jgi:NodT family efflux transporter outer membrane factor (OMF) lipoprotein
MRRAALASAAAVLAACTVGPDFRPPPPPAGGYGAQAPEPTRAAAVPGGEAQRFVAQLDIPGQWWTLLHCRGLDELIARALTANPDIKVAQANLAAARELVRAQRGAFLPSVDASGGVSRQKTAAQLSPVPSSGALDFTLYTAQLSVAYVPDVFGLNRRTVEELGAHAEAARFALAASWLTLSSNLAAAAVQEASLRAQIAATRELIGAATEGVRVLRVQYAHGYAGRLDVAAEESQLAQLSATLPGLQKQLAQQRHLLAALAGGTPGEEPPQSFELKDFTLPQELPLTLPAQLIEQRPDVRQAEENLHAASAQVGIAVANRLPNITLSANLGSSALSAGQLGGSGSDFWSLGAGLTQPLFHGGTLLHQERAARAAYEAAAGQYRSTVLGAFQNVADTLTALAEDAATLEAAVAAEQAAQLTLDLTAKQQQAGYAGTLALISAQQAYQQAVLSRAQAQASRYADTVALFQALGGGWWHTELARD